MLVTIYAAMDGGVTVQSRRPVAHYVVGGGVSDFKSDSNSRRE